MAFMELHEYPRPANDTGIGIHWVPGVANAIGMATLRDFWIPELRAFGVKWVKLYTHDGAQDVAELLLAEGFMPIVRLYRPTPNPNRLGIKELVAVDSLVRAGVRYFEFNSEPDLDREWRGGRVPANGLELVAEETIANMEAILERGGMPAVPALSNGSSWDLVGKIVSLGRKDLFSAPVWQAIHNYSGNRPVDYPYDIGNQEGAAYTERFFQLVNDEVWEEHAWRGRSLYDVNRVRLDRCSPGMTVQEDHACFLAYDYYDSLNRKHLGRSIPILSTEGGYVVGEDVDPRYPATTPNLHLAQTLEICRIMMGTSQRFTAAPDAYFCTAFWLIANAQLGGSSNWWEKDAWYSTHWPAGSLPITQTLKAEPKVVRRWAERGQIGARLSLRGSVINATESYTLSLEKNSSEVVRTQLDEEHRFFFDSLLPGHYLLRVLGTSLEQAVDLSPGQPEMIINLILPPMEEEVRQSVVQGFVQGGAGAMVELIRQGKNRKTESNEHAEWVTMAREDGSFRFINLPPGLYSIHVSPDGSRQEGLRLEGTNLVDVQLTVSGWGYTIETASDQSGVGALRCIVEGQMGVTVTAHSGSWSSIPVYTGSDPDLGDYECEIIVPEAGHYIVSIDDLLDDNGRHVQAEGHVTVDKRRIPLLRFVYTEPQADAWRNESPPPLLAPDHPEPVLPHSAILVYPALTQAREEQVSDSAMQERDLHNALEQTATLENARMGHPTASAEENTPSSQSVIAAHIPLAAGRLARLVDGMGNEQRASVSADDNLQFSYLSAGRYILLIEGGYEQPELVVDGSDSLEVLFTPVVPSWSVQVSNAGSMPGYSVVRVEVQGHRDLPVRIWKDDWDGTVQQTGSKPEHGEFALEFGPLGPGIYMIEPEGLGIWTDVELTGLEAIWVTFQPKVVASAPNTVIRQEARVRSQESAVKSQESGVNNQQPTANNQQSTFNSQLSTSLNDNPSPLTPHPSPLYLWIDQQALSGAALVALLREVARLQPVVGADLAEASLAQHVLILGDATYFASPAVQQLEAQLAAQGISYTHRSIDEIEQTRL